MRLSMPNKYKQHSKNFDLANRSKCLDKKKKFPSREAAQNFLNKIGKADKQYAYDCPYCPCWHLSTRSKAARRERNKVFVSLATPLSFSLATLIGDKHYAQAFNTKTNPCQHEET